MPIDSGTSAIRHTYGTDEGRQLSASGQQVSANVSMVAAMTRWSPGRQTEPEGIQPAVWAQLCLRMQVTFMLIRTVLSFSSMHFGIYGIWVVQKAFTSTQSYFVFNPDRSGVVSRRRYKHSQYIYIWD